MTPGRAKSPNRSRWMRAGRECMQAGDWAGAIRAYAQGLMEQPLLGMHYAANLERARTAYRRERQQINQQGPEHTTVCCRRRAEPQRRRPRRWAAISPSGGGSYGSRSAGQCGSRGCWCTATT
jgi:hypothetical protein